ncbi:Aldo/keto reductase [Pleurotus eryngii]|uniref:Aldo/keto reductase n=1 Tax=Pleurotus eryngii TaxID=5323 RepID=A0A9P5ZUG0_PLEER|nr:Aldo/keto reductase [Pleurotus eryngii]
MTTSSHFPVMETFNCGPFRAPRVWTGLWQLSSNAWGSAPVSKIRSGMSRHVELGYTAFADHYGSSEIIFGQFKKNLSSTNGPHVVGATKWCVFKSFEPSRAAVEAAVQERLERMSTDRLDLLQFHWQDYSDKGYLITLQHLCDLRIEGRLSAIGLCNFDTKRTDEICTQLGPGFIATNQVQFSLIDTRPLHGMADVCDKHDVKILAYGTLCGGFLADKWLDQPQPDLYSGQLTPSQRKYLDMITRAWGNWDLFQDLLHVLRLIGDRHGNVSISNVATRWVLDHPWVGAVIIGARLGLSEHPGDNQKVFTFALAAEDNVAIDAVLARSDGHRLITTIGDCGAEYR